MLSVPKEAITEGPRVNWKHVDGPLMTWATLMHWLTWSERFQIYWGFATVDEVARKRWPVLSAKRDQILAT